MLQKTTTAKEENEKAKELELIKLAVGAAKIAGEGTITKDTLNSELRNNFNDNGITVEEIQDGWSYKSYKIDKDGKVGKLLPDEYQQVEYIESSGTQWINTKRNPSNYTGMKMIVSHITTEFADINFTGARIRGGNRFAFCIYQYEYICYGYGEFYSNNISKIDMEYKNVLALNYKNNRLMLCNTSNYQLNNTNLGINYPIYLFTQNSSTDINTGIGMKVYNFEITEESNIVRSFIPCYSTTTVTDVDGIERPKGTIGMYDTVEGKFYTNQGTGTFGYETEDGTYVEPTNN